jgi:DNA-directed RNA polymerase subunit RPC12/RpoP
MPVRVYKCSKCSKITQIEWKTGMQPKCPCGSNQLQRVAFKSSTPTPPPVVTTPVVTTPVIPEAPPIGDLKLPKSTAFKLSGKTLLQELQASKVGKLDATTGARYVSRNALDQAAYDRYWGQATTALPTKAPVVSGTQEEVSEIIRCVVNNVKVKTLSNLWIDFFFRGRKYYLKDQVNLDLTLPLSEMAKGKCRPAEHGNTNTAFGNMDLQLPTRVQGEVITYLEFGWRYKVPDHLVKTSQNRSTGRSYRYVEVRDERGNVVTDFGFQQAVAKRILDDGGTIEAGLRLVISSWGYLFFSNTHYRSFLIYDPVGEKWKQYGETKNADASWYHSGELNRNWILPVSAPGYW